ncbi:MAG TPA: protein kinase [Candidatus Xenobia bacterium]|jgi:hypothetical protein
MDTVGRFQLVRKLGQGGTGVVWEARDTRSGARVALKILRHGDLTPLEVARFNREYSVLSRLSHANLVQVYEYGMDGGRPFYTMELLEGTTLAALTAAEDLPREDLWGARNPVIFRILFALLDAMEHLHRRGIVHRDVKPGNIMLTPGGGIKLMDFGLARDASVDAVLTEPGTIVGTLRYCSPEQVASKPVDARSDIYAFGVILYELATGRPPFSGDGWPVVSQILKEPVPPPVQFNPRLPGQFAGLMLRCLEKKATNRPQSVGKVRQQLGALADALGVDVPQTETDRRIRLEVAGEQILFAPRYIAPAGMRATCEKFLSFIEGGHNGFMLVYGDEGMGKSRFAEEFEGIAQERKVRVVRSTCEGSGAVPYHAVAPLIQSICHGMSTDELGARFGDAGLARFLEAGEAPDGDPHAEKLKLFAAVSRVVRYAAREEGLLFVVDDIQWADIDNFELLSYLVRDQAYRPAVGDHGVGVAWTCVSEAEPSLRERISRLTSGHVHTEFTLPALVPPDVVDMVGSVLGDDDAAEKLGTVLYRETHGNPAFVVECLKRLVEAGVLAEQDGAWMAVPSWQAVAKAVPRSLADAFGQRLQGLSDSALEVLRIAAILGAGFSMQVLRACGGQAEAVDELLARYVLMAVPGRRQGQLAFVSPRLRRYVVDGLSFEQREPLERQILLGLEKQYQEGDRRVLHALAAHAVQVGDEDRALQYVLLAAYAASSVRSNQRAADLYEVARTMPGFEGRLTAPLRDGIFDVMMSAGRYTAAAKLAEESSGVEADRTRQAHWQHRLGRAMMGLGKSDEALKHFTASLEALGFKTPSQGPALLGSLTWEYLRKGAEGSSEVGEALKVALDVPGLMRMPQRDQYFFNNILRAFHAVREVGDVDMQALVYASYAFMLVMTARPPVGLIRRFLLLATEQLPGVKQVAVRVEICRYAAWSFYLLGDFGAAREMVSGWIELAESWGAAEGQVVLGLIHLWTGPVTGLRVAAGGDTALAMTARMAQSCGLALEQRYAEAERVLVDAGVGVNLETAESLPLLMGRAFSLHVQRQGEAAGLWETLRQRWQAGSLDHVQPQRFAVYAAMGYVRQYQAGGGAGVLEKARRLVREVETEVEDVQGQVRVVEGQLMLLQGTEAKGLAAAEQGLATLHRSGAKLVQTDCRLALAETLYFVGGGLKQAAETQRRVAQALAEELGATAYAAVARLLKERAEAARQTKV